MIEPKSDRKVKVSGDFETSSFGIGKDGLAHIFDLLRNGIYPNAIRAILRELGCNARDSHIEAGIGDRPFHVQLPNGLYPVFKMRDFGTGMTHERVMYQYTNYGDSTKRSSNDYIGQLGIGSKSPFAYCNAFIINSYVNGEKRSYSCYIDETEVGKIALISVEKTDEESGFEIEFPVKGGDIYSFVEEAKGVYKWFDVPPKFFGNEVNIEPVRFNHGDFHIEYGYDSIAVMGSVPYSFNTHEIMQGVELTEGEKGKISAVSNRGLYVKMDIGSIQFTPSREQVKYTLFTKQNLCRRLIECYDKLIIDLQGKVDALDKNYLAKRLYHKIDCTYAGSVIRSLDFGRFKNIESNWIAPVGVSDIRYFKRGNKRPQCFSNDVIPYGEQFKVVISRHKEKLLNYVGGLLDDNITAAYVVVIEDEEAFDKWCKDYEFDLPTIDINSLPYKTFKELGYVSPRSKTGSPTTRNSKYRKNVFLLDTDGEDKDSIFLHDEDFDFESGGHYVIVNKFDLVSTKMDLRDFLKALGNFSQRMGIDKVYAVKAGFAKKFINDKNWVDVWGVFSQFAAKNRKKIIRDAAFERVNESRLLRESKTIGVNKKIIHKFRLRNHGDYCNFFNFLSHKDQQFVHSISNKASKRNNALEKVVRGRYKILDIISPYYYNMDCVKEYVSMVDQQNPVH